MGTKVVVVGLGYVGLPLALALAFGRVVSTIGFEISQEKVDAYRKGYDPTGEMEEDLFVRAKYLEYTTSSSDIANCGCGSSYTC